MSDYTTRAILTASVGNYVSGMAEARNAYKSFKDEMRNTSTAPIDNLGKSSTLVSGVMKRAMAVGATAVTGVSVAAVKTGAEFEHQMSRVAAISGATGKDFTALKKEAIDLGAKTQFSAKEAAEGMENLASAGMKPKQIMEAMPGVLNLAAVSGGNVAEAADDAATAMNGFGIEADKSGHVADVFAKAAADTNAEASDMGQALKMVAPQAHAAGLSLEETSAAIGILSNAGIKGTEAGSNLAMALTKVQNPSEEAKKAMQQIGFSAYDSSGKMKPLAQQVEELRGKLSGMTDQQKQYYMSEMYGVQGGRAMNVLLDSQPGKLEKLTNSLVHSDGAAQKMANRMQDDLSSSIEQLGGAFESLAIAVEAVFDGDLRKGVNAATKYVQEFTKYIQANQGEIQKEIKHIESMAKTFLGFLPSIQQVTAALKILLPAFVALETFKGIGVGATKTIQALETMQADLGLVSQGVTVVSSGMGNFVKIMNAVTLKPFIGTLTTAKDGLSKFYSSLKEGSFVESFKNHINQVIESFKNIGSNAKEASSKVSTALQNMYTSMRHPIKGTDEVTGAFTKMKNSITSSADSMATKLNQVFYGLLKSIGADDKAIAQLTNTAMKDGDAIGEIGHGASKASEGLKNGAIAAGGLGKSLGALSGVAMAIAAVAGLIYYAWSTNFGNIQGVVKTAIGGVESILKPLKITIDHVFDSLKPILPVIENIGKAIGALAIGAIVSAVIALAGALRITVDVLGAVLNSVIALGHGIVGIFEEITTHGKKGQEEFKKAGQSMNAAKNNIKDIGTTVSDTGKTFSDSFHQIGKSADGSKSHFDGVKVSVNQIGDSAKQMKKDFDSSKTKLSDLINNDGVSAKTKEFLKNVESTLTQYQSNVDKASKKYNDSVKKAESKTGSDRLKALNQANANLAKATAQNNQQLLNVTQDLDRQLQQKKFSDGTAMTKDEVKILTDQNNKYKEKLIEQNQIYVQAQEARIKNGQKLNKTQQKATIDTLNANYQLEAQQIQVGEQKIKDLKAKIQSDKDATTKATDEQELTQLQTHQKQLVDKQTSFGQQMNTVIANGSKLNFNTWKQGLDSLGQVTSDQLQSMFLSFVSMNNNTSQQMQAFAYMLQQGGVQGVNGLVQALSDGKFSASEAAQVMNSSTIQGLQSLPNSMFKSGEAGKNSFINALRNGDFKTAGQYLANESAKGASNGKGQHKKAGQKHAKSYTQAIQVYDARPAGQKLADSGAQGAIQVTDKYHSAARKNAKNYSGAMHNKTSLDEAAGAGNDLSKSVTNTLAKANSQYTATGKDNARKHANGIKSEKGKAKDAGKTVASAGADGTAAHKQKFKDAGKQNGDSHNNGLTSKKSKAYDAGKALAQASKNGANSISFHSVGVNEAQGVANGIYDNTNSAVRAMRNLVNKVNREAKRVAKIHSPSALMRDEVGKYLALGVADGIDQNSDEAANAMDSMINKMVKDTSQSAEAMNGAISKLMKNSMESMEAMDAMITKLITKIKTNGLEISLNMPDIDSSDLNRSVNLQAIADKQPAHLTLKMGNNEFNGFVDDISKTQDINLSLNRFGV